MKAIRYHEKGAPDVMAIEELPIPELQAGELLVRVEAAGIAYGDVLRRSGRHYPLPTVLPHLPGGSVAGVVEKVGEQVDAKLLGKRVYGMSRSGGYAEFAAGPAAGFVVLPENVSSLDAVAVLSDGVTAGVILKTVGLLKQGQSVFVPAAAGGLGFVAVQLAKRFGAAKVFGAASSPEKRKLVLEAGADAAIDYTKEGWSKQVIEANGGKGVDLALEMTGGPIFYETLEVVRPGGRIVNYGNASDTDSPVNPRVLLRKNLTLSGFIIAGPYDQARNEMRTEVLTLLEAGKLKAQYSSYPLADAPKAHAAIETRRSTGRQILVP